MRQALTQELSEKIPKPVFSIFKTFQEAGKEIYLVGGGVRDLFLNRPIHDADFTTNATPEEIQKLLPDSFYDNAFGIVGVIVKTEKGEEKYEITTYRTETSYSDHRRPDKVSWGTSLEEDLKRREFTINSMAIGPTTDYSLLTTAKQQTTAKLEIIDNFNGQEDLQNKIIRAVGDPNERFKEDALRMIRAIAFN
ncbi:MAG: hypothetical protein M1514_03390 [Patescibacteria group bacterium]|nr:hypothetical protein [Patescibacteria group bacterium]